VLSPRNRELFGLLPAALLVTAGFTAIFIQAQNSSAGAATNATLNHLSSTSLTYGAIFLALCIAGHVVIRIALPHADPYLYPIAAVLASVGIVIIYRINPTLARQQAQWFVVGLLCFTATIVILRRHGLVLLERYRYTIALVGILMTLLPRFPVIGGEVNGAYLDIHIGGLSFQPAELSKVAIVIFLASYLHDNRQLLVTAGKRLLGLRLPSMKHLGPMLVIWGAAMATLLITGELGTSLMFYGAFLALLYVATGRLLYPLAGIALFALGGYLIIAHVGHVHARLLDWEHPFNRTTYSAPGGSYQLAQSLFAQAEGGLLGTGFDRSLLRLPHHGPSLLPVPESDMIFAVILDELGLVGGIGLLLVYLLFVARGMKIAALARDSFSKLLASGLAVTVALQVFVIVGGVTRLIPLAGVTLPFVAYGGSSVVMNFVLVALLLVVSDRARRPPGTPRQGSRGGASRAAGRRARQGALGAA
jgi:cell division protein FtsW (lipid II flippase)